jgi:hypothetical protein
VRRCKKTQFVKTKVRCYLFLQEFLQPPKVGHSSSSGFTFLNLKCTNCCHTKFAEHALILNASANGPSLSILLEQKLNNIVDVPEQKTMKAATWQSCHWDWHGAGGRFNCVWGTILRCQSQWLMQRTDALAVTLCHHRCDLSSKRSERGLWRILEPRMLFCTRVFSVWASSAFSSWQQVRSYFPKVCKSNTKRSGLAFSSSSSAQQVARICLNMLHTCWMWCERVNFQLNDLSPATPEIG